MPGILERKQEEIPLVGTTLNVVGRYYPEILSDIKKEGENKDEKKLNSQSKRTIEIRNNNNNNNHCEQNKQGAHGHLETLRQRIRTIEILFPDLFQESQEERTRRRIF